MPSSLLFVLLIVVWAFVLAPLVVRNREPIRRTSEALGRTRLLHSGGERVKSRRRPRFTEEDIRRRSDLDEDLSVETVSAELEPESLDDDVLIDDAPFGHSGDVIDGELLLEIDDGVTDDDLGDVDEPSRPEADEDNPRVIADGGGRDLTVIVDNAAPVEAVADDSDDVEAIDASHGDVVEIGSVATVAEVEEIDGELYEDEAVFAAGFGAALAVEASTRDDDEDSSRTRVGLLREEYGEDVADLSKMTTDEKQELTEQLGEIFDLEGDDLELDEDEFLYAVGIDPREVQEHEGDVESIGGAAVEEEEVVDGEMSDEDLEYAAAHRGRGGFDPERDAAYAEIRFARRRRWIRVLALLSVVSLALAAWLGGWFWLAPVVAIASLAGYLMTLRRTVVVERELRLQRIQQLKRRRLGVRSADYDESLPDRLRRPGAIVVELDDEAPEFADLNYGVYDDEYEIDTHRAVG